VIEEGIVPRVAAMATGAWFDPAPAAGEPERNGNPNVLTRDVGTSRLAQGPSALSTLVEIERWDGALPPSHSFTPPPVIRADSGWRDTVNS
jgi:biotin/methionine sulfoxide reductase